MHFQYILNSLSLLASKQKVFYYKITKKIGYLLLAALLSNSVSAIRASDIKNTPPLQCLQYPCITRRDCPVKPTTETIYARYSQSTTTQTPRTFDYDPGLLPEVAEVIFALRIKHTNIGKPFVINLSGNYLLKFTKERIYILDTYTKNIDVYEYQSTTPNITLGLGISKGLPRNFKSIIIKEDAHGQLYDYAALRIDNITTDETILSETLSHPFYQIAGEDDVENEVKVTKAMAFYHERPSHVRPSHEQLSHERHARCVKSSQGIFGQLQDILWGSGTGLCGPKAASDIHSANHSPAKEMELDQPLVEAVVNRKYPNTVGYREEVIYDLKKNENTVALMTSSLYCNKSIWEIVEKSRKRRDVDSDHCVDWTIRIVTLYMNLQLNFNNINEIVNDVVDGQHIAASFFPGSQQPLDLEAVEELESLIIAHPDAAQVLQVGAAETGQAAVGNPAYLTNNQGATAPTVGVQNAVAQGALVHYTLASENFTPLPNIIRRLNSHLEAEVIVGERYTTHVIHVANDYDNAWHYINSYLLTINNWIRRIEEMIARPHTNTNNIEFLTQCHNIAKSIHDHLSHIHSYPNLVIGGIYQNNVIIGIAIGRIHGRVYHPMNSIIHPQSLFATEGAYSGALAYLRSEILKDLFARGLIDSSEVDVNTPHGARAALALGFRHDEL